MSIKSKLKPWGEAADRLARAVSVASLEDLRNPIEKEFGLNKEILLPALLDHVDDLKQLAMLGYPGAIRSLVSVAKDISRFLATLPPHAELTTGDATANSKKRSNLPETQDDPSQKDHWTEINQAAAHLHDVVIKHYEFCKNDFQKWRSELPETPFSFPLEILLGRSEPPDPPLELVADFCDGLIQDRFNSEIGDQMVAQTTGAWFWPVVVSAEDLKANRQLKECIPNLRLGEAIKINIFSGKISGTPKRLATELFKILERERTTPRSKTHRDQLRHDDDNDVPAALEVLIRKEGKTKGNGVRFYACLAPLDSEIASDPENGPASDREPILEETIRLAAEKGSPWVLDYPPLWCLDNIWRRKAALLPELSPDKHIIEKWTEAAFAYAASVCGGQFEKYEWAECIATGTRNTHSITAGLKRTLRAGFKSIAKD